MVVRSKESFNVIKSSHGIRETPKVHIVTRHVAEFLRMTNEPLGCYSEEVVEQQRQLFSAFYERFRVSDNSSNLFLERLFNCVVYFNCTHQ